jgi:hypothetical protein
VSKTQGRVPVGAADVRDRVPRAQRGTGQRRRRFGKGHPVRNRSYGAIREEACEVKRLYVWELHGGMTVADALIDALEGYVASQGYRCAY